MKKIITINTILLALGFLGGHWWGTMTTPIELRLFNKDEMTEGSIMVSDVLLDSMQECAESDGFISVYHSIFESKLVCYNGHEFILQDDGKWVGKRIETL